jgi:hypothetical protein
MIYNTKREDITIREYGRYMQRFIEHAIQLPTKVERQAAAEYIIELMAILNPHLKTAVDYKNKLWDHLHIMSDFKLDVDSPYPVPNPEDARIKPSYLPYPKATMRMRHYGKNVEAMVQRAIETEDPEKKEAFILLIANYMKLAYKNWSNEEVSNDLIREDLRTLSRGKLEVSDDLKIELKNVTGPSQGGAPARKKSFQNNNKNKSNFQQRSGGGQQRSNSGGGRPQQNQNRFRKP